MTDDEQARIETITDGVMTGLARNPEVVLSWLVAQRETCPNPNDTGDGLDHTNDHGETDCPNAPADDPGHCEHWYDGEGCHRCGDPGLPPCSTCHGEGTLPFDVVGELVKLGVLEPDRPMSDRERQLREQTNAKIEALPESERDDWDRQAFASNRQKLSRRAERFRRSSLHSQEAPSQ